MKRAILFIATIPILISQNIAYAQEGYLCVSEAAGGVSYDKGSKTWKGTSFNIKSEKQLITKKGNKWIIKDFGSTLENECTISSASNIMKCDKIHSDLILNTKTLRYISSYLWGYIDGVDNNNNTPHIEIGICTKL